MNTAIKITLVILILFVGALLIIPSFFPLERVIEEAKQSVYEQTGRQLNVKGQPVLSIFPNLHISLDDVSFSNPEGVEGNLVSANKVLVDIAWSSLWHGELAVNAFKIDGWSLTLMTQADGSTNYQMQTTSDAPKPESAKENQAIELPDDVDLLIDQWRLSNGRIDIIAADGSKTSLKNIDIALNMPSLSKTLTLSGRVDWQDETLQTVVELTSLRAFLAGKSADLQLGFKGLENQLSFNGNVASLGQVLRGDLDLGIVDLRNFLGSDTKAKDSAAVAEWDDTYIDLAALKGPDVDVNISMQGMQTPWLNTEQFEGKLRLVGGDLSLNIDRFVAYQGEAKGQFSMSATNQLVTKLSFDKVQVQPLLKDLVDVDKFMGSGQVTLDIQARALSLRKLMQSLSGSIGVNLADGAILGFNLAAIIKSAESVMQGNFSEVSLDQNFAAAEKTDFSSLIAEFAIDKGIATASKVNVLSPLIRVTGEGVINLPEQSIDMLMRSKLVASNQGQGGVEDAKGLTIPVAISGPWTKVKVSPKISDGAKTKAKAILDEKKNELEQKIKDEGAKKLLKGLLNR